MHHLNLLAILVAGVSTMVVGFLWYSPLLFAKPWVREMGYDLNDKAKMEEMRKGAGPAYAGSFVAGLMDSSRRPPLRLDGRIPCLARFRRHRAVHGGPVHEAEHETFRHQYGLPAGLLSRHERDSHCLEVAGPSAHQFRLGRSYLTRSASALLA
jgi:hypothetical protein